MPAAVIDGKMLSARLRASIAERVQSRTGRGLRPPGLAVVLVGEDHASTLYVRSKAKQCVEAGMLSFEFRFSASASECDVLDLVARLNAKEEVDGILIQLPLPKSFNTHRVIAAIDPDKDVDGFHPTNAGRLALGLPGIVPCTPLGCTKLLESLKRDLTGMTAVVVGRSNIVGKPMAQMLLDRDCTVTIAHSKTEGLDEVCRGADILVAAVGIPNFIKGGWIKPGAVVLDVGINRLPAPQGRRTLVGDVDFDEAVAVAAGITPVPGGVGPMTIACLLSNTLDSAIRRNGP